MKYLYYIFAASVLGVVAMVSKIKLNDKNRDQFDPLFVKFGLMYGVKPEMLKTIAMIESDLGQNERVKRGATSYDGKSWGLMQIAPNIGSQKEIELKGINTTPEMLNNPQISIQLASKLLGYLTKKYNGNEEKIVKAYNQGEVNTDKNGPYANSYYQKYLMLKNKIA